MAVLRKSVIGKRENPWDSKPVHPFEQTLDCLADLTA